MTQYAFFFDQSRCYGCHTCSISCKDWNDLQPGPEKWMTSYEWETGSFPNVRLNYLAFSCGHCESPLCLEACPNNAIYKEDKYGAVLVDPDLCKGARQCWIACPYGSPKFANDTPGTKMSKCTMCIDRLERGEKPLCVISCPMRALDFGPLEELVEKYGDLRQLPGMPDPEDTQPAFLFKPAQGKSKLIPYNEQRVLELMGKRGDLPSLYEEASAVTEVPADMVLRDHLVMKPTDMKDLMRWTQHDQG